MDERLTAGDQIQGYGRHNNANKKKKNSKTVHSNGDINASEQVWPISLDMKVQEWAVSTM